jgi:hypothetical protein
MEQVKVSTVDNFEGWSQLRCTQDRMLEEILPSFLSHQLIPTTKGKNSKQTIFLENTEIKENYIVFQFRRDNDNVIQ